MAMRKPKKMPKPRKRGKGHRRSKKKSVPRTRGRKKKIPVPAGAIRKKAGKARVSKKRSEAAKRVWKKRKDRLRDPHSTSHQAIRELRKAGATEEEIARNNKYMIAAIVESVLEQGVRTPAQARFIALGRQAPFLHGKFMEEREVLESFIKNKDYRWEEFLKWMRENGYTDRDARDEWFSPDM